jgi:hypothetical protein
MPDSFKQYDRGWIVVVMPYDQHQAEYVIFSEEMPAPKPLWYRLGKRAVRVWKVYAYLF